MIVAIPGAVAASPASDGTDQPTGVKPVRIVNQQGYRVELDLSSQVLRLSVPEEREFGGGSFGSKRTQEAPLYPTLSQLDGRGFVSASVLAQKAKQFDDGLYAAVDLAAEQGAGKFGGKAALLQALTAALGRQDPAQLGDPPAVIFAAAKLGELEVQAPAAILSVIHKFGTWGRRWTKPGRSL
jgi:hypothetical protein